MELQPINREEDSPLLVKENGQDRHKISFARTTHRSVFEACCSEPTNQETIVAGFERKHLKSILKSVPPYAAFSRYGKDRSLGLARITTFRHWWKQSRLLCRLAGLYVYLIDDSQWSDITNFNLIRKKGPKQALKIVKRLSQGGPLKPFMANIKYINGTVRIIVATWRFIEAAECRRFEVGVAEFIAFCGNRVSRALARDLLDFITSSMVIPAVISLIDNGTLQKHGWHPEVILTTLGVMRAVAPYIFSFYGSWFGRALTRSTFYAAEDRWLHTMRVSDVNQHSQEAVEWDEDAALYKNNDLVDLAKFAATAFGKESDPLLSTKYLETQGFRQVGCGSGGYAVYHYRRGEMSVLLHVTPYGPSIYDELPRYVVLEHSGSQDTRGAWAQYLSQHMFPGPPVVEGYFYKGAFFNSFQYAALREKYNSELECFERACKLMNSMNPESLSPPTDLASLKAFLETGRTENEKRKREAKFRYQEAVVARLVKMIRAKINERNSNNGNGNRNGSRPPTGIILYLDGLDCVGKSSTSTKVQAALEEAGYVVTMCRYNRPPTAEQKQKPWMDRFERPTAVSAGVHVGPDGALVLPEQDPEAGRGMGADTSLLSYQHTNTAAGTTSGGAGPGLIRRTSSFSEPVANLNAYVWDRGPAGDFVYGGFDKLPEYKKHNLYSEFLDFDATCEKENILFCKFLFVADRDSIAKSLGKRLAHKKIAKDLHLWLDSSSGQGGQIDRAGLAEIDEHIDPTDFIAFNKFQKNLNKFLTFAKNTDFREHSSVFNPWLVINTTDRHAASIELLHQFERHFDRFSTRDLSASFWERCDTKLSREHELKSFKKYLYMYSRLLYLSMGLLFMVYFFLNRKYGFGTTGGD